MNQAPKVPNGLIPCPSCDNRYPLLADSDAQGTGVLVACFSCGFNTGKQETPQKAIERWNTRPNKTISTLEKQLLGLRIMIDMGLSWADVLKPIGKGETLN